METLESFTYLPSIMSFKPFPYFLFLTSLLFLHSLLSALLWILSTPPFPFSSAPLCPLGSGSSLTFHIVSCPHHITQQLVTDNQSACLASLDGLFHLLLLSALQSFSSPPSPVAFLSSFTCQELLLSEITALCPPLSDQLRIFMPPSIHSFNHSCCTFFLPYGPSLSHCVPSDVVEGKTMFSSFEKLKMY